MKKMFLISILALLSIASYGHRRVVNATPVSTDTIYYNDANQRVYERAEAAYGRLLLTEGTGRNKRDVFQDYYMNGKLKLEGGYSFLDLSDDNNTQLDGDITAFYQNGKEKWRGTFVNGKPQGYFVMMMRDGSVATAEFENGRSKHDYFTVTAPDGTMKLRDIRDLKSFLKK